MPMGGLYYSPPPLATLLLTGTIICIQWASLFDQAMQVLQEHEVATKLKFLYKFRYKPKFGNIQYYLAITDKCYSLTQNTLGDG